MPFDPQFDPDKVKAMLCKMGVDHARIMEVCGTHTMAIAKSGLKALLPEGIELISGPGCPVCVTSARALDAAFALAAERDVILAAYGDMLRVPGTVRGKTLLSCRAEGADIRTVFSAMDAVTLAEENPQNQVVFLAAGFETTAAGTAAAAKIAWEKRLANFTMLSLLKPVQPALETLVKSPDFSCDAFLLPGHVAAIIGEEGFAYVPRLGYPAVIAGFEPADLLSSIVHLLQMKKHGQIRLENEYTRVVRPQGNVAAKAMIDEVFMPCADIWRGIGPVEGGGFAFRAQYDTLDAWKRFSLDRIAEDPPTACRCADVICGRIAPPDCPMFGGLCTPSDAHGPCMVSSEGACAAAYRYRNFV